MSIKALIIGVFFVSTQVVPVVLQGEKLALSGNFLGVLGCNVSPMFHQPGCFRHLNPYFMFSYKFFIHTGRGNDLRLRIINNRRKVELSTGCRWTPEDLEKAISGRSSQDVSGRKKYLAMCVSQLESLKMQLAAEGRQREDVRVIGEIVRDSLFGGRASGADSDSGPGVFVKWFLEFAESHNNPESTTKKHYLHTLSRMRAYCPAVDGMDFPDIDLKWLEGFDAYLARTCKLNTRHHHLRNIRAVIKYAIRHDLDIRNPFDRMRLKKEETAKRALCIEDLRWIFNCEVLPYAEIYRDMFKLSFMLIGINAIDLYRLERPIYSGRINYRRAKTHKLYSVKVEPEAMQIIEKYMGAERLLSLADRWESHESFSSAANKALRLLGAPAPAPGRSRKGLSRFPEITMYWARHTWATIAAELDVPDAVISQALGHSCDTNSVTAIYIRRNEKKVDEANRRVLDWVLYGKR